MKTIENSIEFTLHQLNSADYSVLLNTITQVKLKLFKYILRILLAQLFFYLLAR